MKKYLTILIFLITCQINTAQSPSGTFTDIRDGQTYNWVQIGNQIWMAENLNYYTSTGSRYYNDDSLTYSSTYGRYYTWTTAQNVCPSGWHLPDTSELYTLTDYLGGISVAGGKMKEAGTTRWNSPNSGATNESGFNALPGGYHNNTTFAFLEQTACFMLNIDNWWFRLYHDNTVVDAHGVSPGSGGNVRCVKNNLDYSLIANYPFTGNAADSSGNGNHGTVYGATLTTDRFGDDNSAYSFDGVNDWIDINSFQLGTNEITISTWLKYVKSQNYYSMIFNIQNVSSNSNGNLNLIIDTTNDYGPKNSILFTRYEGGWIPTYTATSIKDNEWINIVAIWNKLENEGKAKIYINGIEASLLGNPVWDMDISYCTDPIRIGARTGTQGIYKFSGSIDEFNVYNRSITESEILQLYANYHPPDSLIAEAGNQQVTLTWNSERIEGLAKYKIYRDSVLHDSVIISSINDTIYTDINLSNYQTYSYYITSVDTFGNESQPSDTISVVPTDGLIAYYPFTGNAADSSGNENHGDTTGHAPTLTTDRFGNENNAYYFDGVDDYIEISGESDFDISTSASWSAWIKYDSLMDGFIRSTIIGKWRRNGINRAWELAVDEDDRLALWISHDGSDINATRYKNNYPIDNSWHHIIAVYDSIIDTVKIYLDGKCESSGYCSDINLNDQIVHIGDESENGNSKFNGKIDEIKIWRRTLDESEIHQLYANYHAPDTFLSEPGDQKITLKWSSERISGLSQYTIYRDSVLHDSVIVSSINDTIYTDINLTNYQTYSYFITSIDTFGNESQPSDTISIFPCEIVTDIDGNEYKTTKIGEQVWIAENLKTTKYTDNSSLLDGTGVGDITGDYTSKYYFWYDDDSTNYANTYGALYTWAAAMNGEASSNSIPSGIQGVCPDNYHLPSESEWQILEVSLGMPASDANEWNWRGTNEGGKLKATGTKYWNSPNTGATNEYGFNALPAGSRDIQGSYDDLNLNTEFWTATEGEENYYSIHRRLTFDSSNIYKSHHYQIKGYSVRCVKDSLAFKADHPFMQSPQIYSTTYFDNTVDWVVVFSVSVTDAQGYEDIDSVWVVGPDMTSYQLYDDGSNNDKHANDGEYVLYMNTDSYPQTGEYTFYAIDKSSNLSSLTDTLHEYVNYVECILPNKDTIFTHQDIKIEWGEVPDADLFYISVHEPGWGENYWSFTPADTQHTVNYNKNSEGKELILGNSYDIVLRAIKGKNTSENQVLFAYRETNDRTIYVDISNDTETETGTIDYPFNTIQEGINASISGDTVIVYPGTYYDNVKIHDKNIVLGSKYLITCDTSYISKTVIDGNENGIVCDISGCKDTIEIKGFTITNGAFDYGAGMNIHSSLVSLKYLNITDNTTNYGGAGINIGFSSNVIIDYVTISNNIGIEGSGGGIFFESEDGNNLLSIQNSLIKNNTASKGAGCSINGGIVTILNTEISNNNAPNIGSAIRTYPNSNVTIINSLIYNNDGNSAFHFAQSQASFINTTIVDNPDGGFNIWESTIEMKNCILWNTEDNDHFDQYNIQYSLIEGGASGIGNIDAYPHFVDTANGDYRLLDISPCINAGTPDTSGLELGYWDLDRNPRVTYDTIDIGAYEFVGVHRPASKNYSVCYGEYNPNMTATGQNLKWYSDEMLTQYLDSSDYYQPTNEEAGIYTYYVTQTIDGEESPGARIDFTIYSLPQVNLGNDTSIAYMNSLVIDPEVIVPGISYTFDWDPGDKLEDSTIINPTTINLLQSAVFELIVTDSQSSCSSSDDKQVLITGGELSVDIYSIINAICIGDSVQLTAIPTGGIGTQKTYSWTSNPAGFSSDISNPVVKPTATTTYSLVYSDGDTTAMATKTITVNSTLPPDAEDKNACKNSTEGHYLTATGDNLKWYRNIDDNQTIHIGDSLLVNNNNIGSYTYYVTQINSNCESNSTPVNLTILALPSINLGPDTTVCPGELVLDPGDGFVSYSWNTGSTDQTIIPTVDDNYAVEVTDSNNCQSSDTIYVEIVTGNFNDEEICMVTVNDDGYCQLIWDTEPDKGIESYIIYRKAPGDTVYNEIARTQIDDNNYYVDDLSSPETGKYSYQIAAYDICGKEYTRSLAHTTIFLDTIKINNENHLGWNPYIGSELFSDYIIYRGTEQTELWAYDGTSGTSWNDEHPNFGTNYYQVVVATADACKVNNGTDIEYTKSNIVANDVTVSMADYFNEDIKIYPNPVKDELYIEFTDKKYKNISIKLISIDGQIIYESGYDELIKNDIVKINVKEYKQGFYLLFIQANNNINIQKIFLR